MTAKPIQWLVGVLFLQVVVFLPASPLYAQSCSGGVELWRELATNGDLVIHCRRIGELTADEWRNLSPAAVAALSREDRARLDARRKALGIVLVVSPSQNLTPETRDFYERQVAMLDAKRKRAQQQLDKINSSREAIHQGDIFTRRVIRDLSNDSVSHSLSVLKGILLVYGKAIPAETQKQIDAAISTATFLAHGNAYLDSEPDSQRQQGKLLKSLNALKNLVPASVVGIDAREWETLKRITDTIPGIIALSERLVNSPGDMSLWQAMAASVDNVIDVAGSLPLAGAPIKAAHSAAMLLDSGFSLWYLAHDRNDLRAASAGNQTAKRYWLARIGEIDELQSVYRTSLAGGGN